MNTRSVSITHLVFGLIFLGVTSLWVVGATTDVEAPALAIWGPIVLIAAGLVGLAATVLNARTGSGTISGADAPARPDETEPATSGVLDDEEQS